MCSDGPEVVAVEYFSEFLEPCLLDVMQREICYCMKYILLHLSLMKVLMSIIILAVMVRALGPISLRLSPKVGSGPISDPFPVENRGIHFRSQICKK